MTRIKEHIATLIVLLMFVSRGDNPVLEGRKKKFSISPPPIRTKKTIPADDIFEQQT